MIIYRHAVVNKKDGIHYGISELDTEKDDIKELAANLQFDKPVRMDIPDENMILFLFNNKLASEAFKCGMDLGKFSDEIFARLGK